MGFVSRYLNEYSQFKDDVIAFLSEYGVDSGSWSQHKALHVYRGAGKGTKVVVIEVVTVDVVLVHHRSAKPQGPLLKATFCVYDGDVLVKATEKRYK